MRRFGRAFLRPADEFDIERINGVPMDALKFTDFSELKSGRDQFSGMRLPRLIEQVSQEDWQAIQAEFGHDDDRAMCLRWRLRGLDLDKAIRKVNTDLEIRQNAASSRRKPR